MMNTVRILRPCHPAKPVPPYLGQLIDRCHALCERIRQSQEAERELTREILAALGTAGLTRCEGTRAVAILAERTSITPDPQRFCEALGPRGYAALSVSVTVARRLLGADDLAAISEATTSPVLRVEPRKAVA